MRSTSQPDAALTTSPPQLRATKLTAIKRLLRRERGHLEHWENNHRGGSAESAKGWSDRADTPNRRSGPANRVRCWDARLGGVRPPTQARPIQKRAIR